MRNEEEDHRGLLVASTSLRTVRLCAKSVLWGELE